MRRSSWDEDNAPVVEPQVILPSQFFTRLQRAAAWTGEQRLMAAILEDAIAVCGRPAAPPHEKARALDRQTWAWVRSNDRTWPFSFLRICEALSLSPSAVRRGLRLRRTWDVPRVLAAPPAEGIDEAPARRAAAG
jgi:hypothetical protein